MINIPTFDNLYIPLHKGEDDNPVCYSGALAKVTSKGDQVNWRFGRISVDFKKSRLS